MDSPIFADLRRAGLVLCGVAVCFQCAMAAPGDPDPTFGTNGKIMTIFPNGGGIEINYPRAIAAQPDGKIVVSGRAYSSQTQDDFALARYNADGSLDSTFGSGGTVRTDFFGLTDQAHGVAILPDGK